ncbi:MAG: hypothetical protein GX418_12320 [Clostridiales bacterium]|nr:hypothetical protein [Clostridiales bacterium]
MTTWQAMAALEGLGYRFEITAEGKIRGTVEGKKPPEASGLLEIVRRDRDSAAAYVKERQAGATVVDDGSTYSMFDAVAICGAIRDGEAQLFGMVTYHRRADTVTIKWEPLNGQTSAALLDTRREALRNALQGRLCVLEVLPDGEMTGDEIDRLNAEYGRCKRLLEGYKQ